MCSFGSKMGLSFSSLRTILSSKRKIRMLMVGLNGSGQTTILYHLKLEKVIPSIPTNGFNIETVTHKDIFFTIWDIANGDKYPPLWYHYYGDSEGVIFVVDSTDRRRIEEAETHLHCLFSHDELRDAVLLVYANKQDCSNSMSPAEIAEKLHLHELGNRKWYVQVASAVEGRGLREGLNWLANVLTLH